MSRLLLPTTIVLVILMTTSCQTYRIPTSSFINQLSKIDSTSLESVSVIGPFGESYEYLANPLQTLSCIDKNGTSLELSVKPSLEIRVHDLNGKKTIFYFDRTVVIDSVLIGARSRLAENGLLKAIKLKNIRLIEVQDGKKDFRYSGKSK